uniref:hypothetical protein n=1 Tax=Chitinophaga ginsengisoli TaxID=363837 RepID=UPI0011B1CD05|nr:hypothetical protein [Chitinophaga ginsengisoli]
MDNQHPQFPKDFFKQFRSKEEFHTFFNGLFKQGVEEMLKAELDEHIVMRSIALKAAIQEIAVMGLTKKRLKPNLLATSHSIFLVTAIVNLTQPLFPKDNG